MSEGLPAVTPPAAINESFEANPHPFAPFVRDHYSGATPIAPAEENCTRHTRA